jgi:hypothetical protein
VQNLAWPTIFCVGVDSARFDPCRLSPNRKGVSLIIRPVCWRRRGRCNHTLMIIIISPARSAGSNSRLASRRVWWRNEHGHPWLFTTKTTTHDAPVFPSYTNNNLGSASSPKRTFGTTSRQQQPATRILMSCLCWPARRFDVICWTEMM